MRKKDLLLLLPLVGSLSYAQVGIGTAAPGVSQALEVVSTNKGVLFPNVNIPDLSQAPPVANPATSLFVYNTNDSNMKGFYYWRKNQWTPLLDVNNVYSILGIIRAETVKSTSGAIVNEYTGAQSYEIDDGLEIKQGINKGENYAEGKVYTWTPIPGMEKSVKITRASNRMAINIDGIAQAMSLDYTAGDNDNNRISYSVAIFINDKLKGVRNFTLQGKGNCVFGNYNFETNFENIQPGQYTVKAYATTRVTFVDSQAKKYKVKYGEKHDGCINLSVDMSKSLMNIQVSEK